MKRILFTLLMLASQIGYSQDIRFNDELDKFCRQTKKDFASIPAERRAVLNSIAEQLTKKKYIGFTCETNSRRTMLLQTWAKTAFLFYGLNQKFSFSVGDTVTAVYPEVVNILQLSGFYYNELEDVSPKSYVIYIGKDIPLDYIVSKSDFGTIDIDKSIVVNICSSGEHSTLAAAIPHVDLAYQSPTVYEKTPQEKQKYEELNRQIATEMLYLAKRTKELVTEQEGVAE
jgi:arsenate reductase